MKIILSFLFLVTFSVVSAQDSILKFDKKFYECENEWVTLPKANKDTTYMLGLIYFDPYKGYVFNKMSEFKIDENKFIPTEKQITSSVIIVISNPDVKFSILPKSSYKELNIDKLNQTINTKRYDEKSPEDLVKKGYHLNHVGASDIAVTVLEKANKMNSKTKGLLFELAFAYNATKQYDKSIRILHLAIKNETDNYLLYKELIFALINKNQLGNAEVAYGNAVKICKNNSQRVEMAYNLTYAYFSSKNLQKFKEWGTVTKELTDEQSQYYKNVVYMETEISK